MYIKLLCNYCGFINEKYTYSIECIEEKCTKCDDKLTKKNLISEKSTNCYGYKK